MPVKIPTVTKRRAYMRVKTKFPILSDGILSNILHQLRLYAFNIYLKR